MSGIIAWIKGLTLTGKIIAAVVAGVVVIGGTTTAIIVATSGGDKTVDTGTPTSSVTESLSSETESADTSETESAAATEESSSTAASSQTETPPTTPSSQAPATSSTTPQPAAFSVYVNGKAVDLGTLERITQKVTLKNELDESVRREISGDVYADAEKFISAIGLKPVSDKVKADIGKRASTDNVLLVENKRTESADGYAIEWFAIVEGSNVMARSGMGYDKNDNITGEGYNPGVLSTLAPKMASGKLYAPVGLICELLGCQYELKDTGFYITK